VLQAAVVVDRDHPPDLAYLVPKEAHKEVETPEGSAGSKGTQIFFNIQLL